MWNKIRSNFAAVFIILIALSSYACLRLLTYQPNPLLPLERYLEFTAPNPFVGRMLMPLLADMLVVLGLSTHLIFGVLEWCSLVMIFFGLWRLFTLEGLAERQALLAASGIFPLLSFVQLLNLPGSFYHPYDSSAIAFTVWGLLALRTANKGLLLFIVAVGTINRETTLLLLMLWWFLPETSERSSKRISYSFFGLLVLLYVVERLALRAWFANNPLGAVYLYRGPQLLLLRNLQWLSGSSHSILIFLASIGFMPLLWLALKPFVPKDWKNTSLPILALLFVYSFIAYFDEPRVFGEIFSVMYCAICLGLVNWLKSQSCQASQGFTLKEFAPELAMVLPVLILGFSLIVSARRPVIVSRSLNNSFNGCIQFPISGNWQLELDHSQADTQVRLEGYDLLSTDKPRVISLGLPADIFSLSVTGSTLKQLKWRYLDENSLTQPIYFAAEKATGKLCRNAAWLYWGKRLKMLDRYVPSLDAFGMEQILAGRDKS